MMMMMKSDCSHLTDAIFIQIKMKKENSKKLMREEKLTRAGIHVAFNVNPTPDICSVFFYYAMARLTYKWCDLVIPEALVVSFLLGQQRL